MPPSAESVERNMLIASSVLSGLMVLEYTWSMRFEIQVIRKRFWKSKEIKIFVISRYAGLFGQIFNTWFATRMESGLATNRLLPCQAWYTYQASITEILTLSGEILLMIRVHDMYKNDKYILWILFVFGSAQGAAMVVSARMVVPGTDSSPTCTVVQTHVGQIYVGASTIAVHLTLLAMIMWRYFRGNWPDYICSYLRVMIRDCSVLVIGMTGIYLAVAIIPTGIVVSQTVSTLLFPLLVFAFWFPAGRLVLNKERFRHNRQNPHEFTTVDLDNLDPSVGFDVRSTEASSNLDPSVGFDVRSAETSEFKVVPTEVKSIAIDTKLGAERDIADESPSNEADDALPSSCVSTALRMGMGNGDEESGSGIAL